MALALRNGYAYNGEEIVIERSDRQRVTVLAHVNPLRDDDGDLTGAVNILVDISDRKRAEQAQALLAAIVESSDDAIVSKTLDGVTLTWNAGAQRLFGYTAEEMIGSSVLRLIPPDRANEEEAILSRLRRGERIDHYETVRIRKDGRPMDISLTISPIRDGNGRIVAASKVARDITSRRQSDEALLNFKDQLATQLVDLRRLHEMSLHLSTTLELTPILQEILRTATAIEGTDLALLSLYDHDRDRLEIGASLGFERAWLAAISQLPSARALCGSCFSAGRRVVIEDVEQEGVDARLSELASGGGFRAVHNTPLMTRDGRTIGVLSTCFRHVRQPTDRETHLLDLCARQAVDYIENARLYDALREADRRKDEFLAMLAHELRNPLAPLSNSLQILRLTEDLPPAVEHVRDIMQRQVDHMVRLVDDLLEVSRITRGKIELRKRPVELMSVIGSAIETSRPLIEANQHQLAVSLSPEPLPLEADAVRLAQVVANLLNNAAKYTPAGGQIWLSARREGPEALISIRDTGVGIAREMLPKVFDLFAQVDRTLVRAQGGLGIGLTLARNLVQMHGGRIEARSDGAGKGSEFVVRLPLSKDAAVESEYPATASSAMAATLKTNYPAHRILVVDDTPAALYVLAKLLKTMNQEVFTADNAAAAIAVARAEKPDLVISDIAMPDTDGYELARTLRGEPALAPITLCALTGYGQESDRQRAIAAGFDHHLIKPVSFQSLEALLRSLGESRHRPDPSAAAAKAAEAEPSR
jgi:PAS domain S-box-containing protein